MAKVLAGRYTARIDGPFVVFLIGMRVNRMWAFRDWVPTALAMPPMIKELYTHPEMGFLGGQASVYWRGAMVTQYWRSFDHLLAYARARDAHHLPAWKRFNQQVGENGSVGVWHETFQVEPGRYEAIYVNTPRFGLGACVEPVPATGPMRDAQGRMSPAPIERSGSTPHACGEAGQR